MTGWGCRAGRRAPGAGLLRARLAGELDADWARADRGEAARYAGYFPGTAGAGVSAAAAAAERARVRAVITGAGGDRGDGMTVAVAAAVVLGLRLVVLDPARPRDVGPPGPREGYVILSGPGDGGQEAWGLDTAVVPAGPVRAAAELFPPAEHAAGWPADGVPGGADGLEHAAGVYVTAFGALRARLAVPVADVPAAGEPDAARRVRAAAAAFGELIGEMVEGLSAGRLDRAGELYARLGHAAADLEAAAAPAAPLRVTSRAGSVAGAEAQAVISAAHEVLTLGSALPREDLDRVYAAGPGEIVVTGAPGLAAGLVIHAGMPGVPGGGDAGLVQLLYGYQAAVRRADELGLEHVAVRVPRGGDGPAAGWAPRSPRRWPGRSPACGRRG